MLSLDCSCPRAESAKAKISRVNQRTTQSDFPKKIAARLESQSRLITHRHAVEHVTRRGGFPMSREIGIKDWARLGHHHPGNLRSQIPVALNGDGGLDLRDAWRLRRLVNLQRKHGRADQNGGGRLPGCLVRPLTQRPEPWDARRRCQPFSENGITSPTRSDSPSDLGAKNAKASDVG